MQAWIVVAFVVAAAGGAFFFLRPENLMLRWYEREIVHLDIPERPDEAIVTYPLS